MFRFDFKKKHFGTLDRSEEEIQEPQSKKKKKISFVTDQNTDFEECYVAVEKFWKSLHMYFEIEFGCVKLNILKAFIKFWA